MGKEPNHTTLGQLGHLQNIQYSLWSNLPRRHGWHPADDLARGPAACPCWGQENPATRGVFKMASEHNDHAIGCHTGLR
jgi:hypothetical protein